MHVASVSQKGSAKLLVLRKIQFFTLSKSLYIGTNSEIMLQNFISSLRNLVGINLEKYEKQAILKLDALPNELFTFLCYCALKNSRIFVLIESQKRRNL